MASALYARKPRVADTLGRVHGCSSNFLQDDDGVCPVPVLALEPIEFPLFQVDTEAPLIKAMQDDLSAELVRGSRAVFYEGCAKKEERRCLQGITH